MEVRRWMRARYQRPLVRRHGGGLHSRWKPGRCSLGNVAFNFLLQSSHEHLQAAYTASLLGLSLTVADNVCPVLRGGIGTELTLVNNEALRTIRCPI